MKQGDGAEPSPCLHCKNGVFVLKSIGFSEKTYIKVRNVEEYIYGIE